MATDFHLKIARPTPACVACGAPLHGVGKHPSALYPAGTPAPGEGAADLAPEAEADGPPSREDYCVTCWQEVEREGYIGFWMARREDDAPRPLLSRKQRNATLLSYFEHLYRRGDVADAQQLFFLAHLLMRYSVLRWVRNEAEAVVFAQPQSGEEFVIREVVLDDAQLVAIKQQVDNYLASIAAEEAEGA